MFLVFLLTFQALHQSPWPTTFSYRSIQIKFFINLWFHFPWSSHFGMTWMWFIQGYYKRLAHLAGANVISCWVKSLVCQIFLFHLFCYQNLPKFYPKSFEMFFEIFWYISQDFTKYLSKSSTITLEIYFHFYEIFIKILPIVLEIFRFFF